MFIWEDEFGSKMSWFDSLPSVWASEEYDFCGKDRNIRMGVAYLHYRYGVPLDALRGCIPEETGEKTLGMAPTVCAVYVDDEKEMVHMVLGDRPFRGERERETFFEEIARDPIETMERDQYFDHSRIIDAVRRPLDEDYSFSFEICVRSFLLYRDMAGNINPAYLSRKRTFTVLWWMDLVDIFKFRI